MQQLTSTLSTASDVYTTNREGMLKALATVEKEFAKALAGGGEKYVSRHKKRGKLLVRERLELLLDRDSYFLEIAPLAGTGMGGVPGASMVGGVGLVSGTECLVIANDPTVQGGAVNEIAVIKGNRLGDVAIENNLPAVSLVESAGADLPNQAKIFVPGGRTFGDITKRSRNRMPSICCVFGSSTAGGAYLPGMADYAIMVKEQAQVYLAGPPLVKMATGEDADDESLGGAEMHSRTSGVSDFLAQDEADAIRIARELVETINWRKLGPEPAQPPVPPLYDPEELLGVASADVRVAFDMHDVLARVVDGSRFLEFKPLYGSTLICGWAYVHGYLVGVLANNGVLFSDSACKGAQFIQLCNQRHIPLLFFQNITGFMVGTKYEQEGIIKHGAKLINAVTNSTVPAITIMMGASYGAGNYAMCGRAYAPRFLFSWPNHRIAVMGGEQLAGVLDIIKRQSAARKNEPVDEQTLAFMKGMIQQQIEGESQALYATARLWDDGIIDPRKTRDVVGICLSAAHNAPVEGTMGWGVFRH